MNIKHILLTAAALAMALTLAGCDKDKYGKVEQGRVIAFDKEKKEVTVIHDSAMDTLHPVYDVLPPAADHLMPPDGKVDFAGLKKIAQTDVFKVIEPAPSTPEDHIRRAVEFLHQTWGESRAKASTENQK